MKNFLLSIMFLPALSFAGDIESLTYSDMSKSDESEYFFYSGKNLGQWSMFKLKSWQLPDSAKAANPKSVKIDMQQALGIATDSLPHEAKDFQAVSVRLKLANNGVSTIWHYLVEYEEKPIYKLESLKYSVVVLANGSLVLPK